MKLLRFISTIIVLTCFFGCEPTVTFNEPQPADTDNLTKFPKRLQGQYLSLEDSSNLFVLDNVIIRTYDYESILHPNQLNNINATLSGDTLIDNPTNEKTAITYLGDSIKLPIHCVDTIFQLDYDNVVRKFKGYYFLNTRYDKANWEVKKVKLAEGQLVISRISTKLEIEKLIEITDSPNDTVPPYNIKATKRQFKEFIKSDGFNDSETFVKQK
jgi:hypothetical protein